MVGERQTSEREGRRKGRKEKEIKVQNFHWRRFPAKMHHARLTGLLKGRPTSLFWNISQLIAVTFPLFFPPYVGFPSKFRSIPPSLSFRFSRIFYARFYFLNKGTERESKRTSLKSRDKLVPPSIEVFLESSFSSMCM